MKYLFLKITFLFSIGLWSQDTLEVFSFEKYISIVKEHHPISCQANLKVEKGVAKILKAKGGFDPKLAGEAQQKYFEGSQYYSYLNAGLKIPSWFGVSFQGGYGNTDGVYLNSESRTPDEGLWYAGVTLNLGKGLLIDKRRAELKQAKIYQNSTVVEQKLMLNQLIFDASIAYWDWYKAYNKVGVYYNALDNAQKRHDGIKVSSFLGEKPFVDTLKSLIQVQNRQLKLEQSKLQLVNKKVYLETFLWQDGFVPLVIDTNLTPKKYTITALSSPKNNLLTTIDSLVNNHPEMLYYQYGIDIAKVEYRLKKDNLKPLLQLKYNAISAPNNENILGGYDLNNYNWGAKVSYPIFTRKERGDLRLSDIKIREQESILLDKQVQIKYKLIASYNSWKSTAQQVQIYSEAVINYQALFNAELTLFNIGESSLFLLNYREQELIHAQIKLIELLYRNYTARAEYRYQVFYQ